MPIFQHYLMRNFQGCQDFNLEVTFRLPQSACRGGRLQGPAGTAGACSPLQGHAGLTVPSVPSRCLGGCAHRRLGDGGAPAPLGPAGGAQGAPGGWPPHRGLQGVACRGGLQGGLQGPAGTTGACSPLQGHAGLTGIGVTKGYLNIES